MGQVVALALINPMRLVWSTLAAQQELCVVDKHPTTKKENSRALRLPQPLYLATLEQKTEDTLDILKRDPIPAKRR